MGSRFGYFSGLVLFLVFILPGYSWADESCGTVRTNKNWYVTFKIENANLNESITVEKSNGNNDQIFWSDNVADNSDGDWPAFFDNTNIQSDETYEVWISYTPNSSGSSNRAGSTTYYLQIADNWYEIVKSQSIDFSGVLNSSGKKIQFWSDSEGVSSLKCAESSEVPDTTEDGTINTSPQFEFGTVDQTSCSMSDGKYTCTITFENSYDSDDPVPLVFVMPTINADLTTSSQTEYPSTVSVTDVSHASATIVQEFASHNSARNSLTFLGSTNSDIQNEMASVDYFVIEPGVLELNNGAKIVAGSVETAVAASQQSSEKNNSVEITFEDYGLDTFDDTPGILVQPQTKNNGADSWFTGLARGSDETSFQLALEKSEVYKYANSSDTLNKIEDEEKVAFVAGEGYGYINGQRFYLGDGETAYTLSASDTVIDPVSLGCSEDIDFPAGADFDEAPILVAKKNSRDGNNGGWLRRCNVTNSTVAFIVEEDMQRDAERAHYNEDVGYFMFEKTETSEMCYGFEVPVQTWSESNGTLKIWGSDATIVGAPILDGNRVVGFLPDNVTSQAESCSGSTCVGNEGLLIGKDALENLPSDLGDSLTVIPNEDPTLDDEGTTLDNDSISYETLSVGGTVKIKSGNYKIGTINIWGNGKIIIEKGNSVTITTSSLAISNNGYLGIDIQSYSDSGTPTLADAELRVNVLSDDSQVNLNTNSTFVGLLYSEQHVEMSGNATVYGAISALSVQMTSSTKIHAATSCIASADSYEITLSPTSQLALMCGDELPGFSIETTNNSESESLAVTAELTSDSTLFDIDSFNITVANSTGTGSYPNFTTSTGESTLGELDLEISVTDPSTVELNTVYTLTLTVDDDTDQTQSATFEYVPFKFDIDDQNVIAGKLYSGTEAVTAQVLGCSGTNQVVVENYTGEPDVTIDITTPSSGRVTDDNDDSLLSYSPEFTSDDAGTSTDSFVLKESGQFTVTLTDSTFSCDPTAIDGCPIDSEGDSESETVELTGVFGVNSRPWKVAICDVKSTDDIPVSNPATTNSGSGFIPGGSEFSVTYKPILHRDSSGGESDACDYPLTENYYTVSDTSAPLNYTFAVAYPTDGDLGNFDSDNSSEFTGSEASSGKTETYTWDEVGSLTLTTSDNTSYLGMDLDTDTQTIGRFYPQYFRINSSSWDYPESQSFAYMNQPFDSVSFEVEALNASQEAIVNYADFTDKAEFYLDELNSYSDRFDAPDTGEGDWSTSTVSSLSSFTISGGSTCSASPCWEKGSDSTYPDGPFNSSAGAGTSTDTDIGLIINTSTNHGDPVEYVTDSLITQPDIRFGRMVLDDVGGNEGATISVPLTIEYYNGSGYVTHTSDSQTDVIGDKEKQSHTWTEDGSGADVTLGSAGQVSSGESRSLTATQASAVRQQTEVWLELDGSENFLPWLQFDWDDDDDEENPSTVITFGTHRGNDRVIFRGEPGSYN